MAYRLNRKLALEEPFRQPDGAGGFTESWIPLGHLWAQITARTGRETAGVAATLSRVPYKIIVRAAPVGSVARPKANQRFRDGVRVFVIASVTEDDVEGRYLVCTAKEETVA